MKQCLKRENILASIAKNVAVKVPLTVDGLKTCKKLREKNIMVNVTLCFSAAQALLAAKAGASFISPFVGRLDDIGEKGMDLIEDIVIIYENYGFDTEVLVASVRTTQHVIDAALNWCTCCQLYHLKLFMNFIIMNLTDKGLKLFLMIGQKLVNQFFQNKMLKKNDKRALLKSLSLNISKKIKIFF